MTRPLEATETWKDVTIADSLSPEQNKLVDALLAEFTDVFTDLPGLIPLIEHQIRLTDSTPIRQKKTYRVAESQKGEFKRQVAQMLAMDVIRESKSPFASPVVLVKKKDGSLRFCIYFRKVNERIVDSVYPIPRPDELLEKKARAQYISTFDMSKGYWQILVCRL